ncbi:MAG: hypothetical protein IPK07_05495 [Deltaproteobacteria bacterium]|nr:hypothetical protein [Deltaproteobacteria bacterium]
MLSLVFSLAYRITDWLSIGGGFMPNFDSLQDNHANVRLNAPEGDPTMGTDLELEQEATGTFTPLLGILIKAPNEGLRDVISLGLSYRGRVKNYFGTGRSDQSVGLGLPDLSFFQLVYIRGELVNFVGFVPEQYSAGLGLHPMERLTVGLDLTYKRWEDFTFWLDQAPNPGSRTRWFPGSAPNTPSPSAATSWVWATSRTAGCAAATTTSRAPTPRFPAARTSSTTTSTSPASGSASTPS